MSEIRAFVLPVEGDLFAELSASVRWEDVGKGRRGAVLTRIDGNGRVPLVRATTRFASSAQRFREVHERLARQIEERVAPARGFNNALVELYTNDCTKMGSHSDQALDLAEDSWIAVFSCYRNADQGTPRKLVLESKDSGGGCREMGEIPLVHNSVVAFSVDGNRRFRHKIVLDAVDRGIDNLWLGVTLRTSKTFVRFRDGQAYLRDGERLVSADDAQRHEFYRLRRRENRETDFVYPPLPYTVSDGDLMPPG